MSGLLYYLPTARPGVTVEELHALGLAYAFDAEQGCARVGAAGPDGERGLIVGYGNAAAIGYYPSAQTWRRMTGLRARGGPAPVPWVGFYREDRPQPEHLERRERLPGHPVRLLDALEWHVPVARAVADTDSLAFIQNLPAASTIDDQGLWQPGAVLPAFAGLWELAERWWDAVIGAQLEPEEGEGTETRRAVLQFEELHDGAVRALAANYRLGRDEVALLGLLDARTAAAVLNALVDLPTLLEWFKKKRAPAG
jgi:hypothetical protein